MNGEEVMAVSVVGSGWMALESQNRKDEVEMFEEGEIDKQGGMGMLENSSDTRGKPRYKQTEETNPQDMKSKT